WHQMRPSRRRDTTQGSRNRSSGAAGRLRGPGRRGEGLARRGGGGLHRRTAAELAQTVPARGQQDGGGSEHAQRDQTEIPGPGRPPPALALAWAVAVGSFGIIPLSHLRGEREV